MFKFPENHPLSLGCMSLPLSDEKTCARIIDMSIDNGITLFDTADLYQQGANETMLGILLKSHRTKIKIATKVGNQLRPDGSGWDWNPRKDYILKAVERSLKRLQIEQIDLYYLHGGTLEDPTEESIEAFENLKEQGKIAHYGISSIRPAVVKRWTERSNISALMTQYSIADRRPEQEIIPEVLGKNVGIMVRGALVQGKLHGVKTGGYLQHSEEAMAKATTQLKSWSQEYGVSVSSMLLHFVFNKPGVQSIVAGVSGTAQLLELFNALKETPSKELLTKMKDLLPIGSY